MCVFVYSFTFLAYDYDFVSVFVNVCVIEKWKEKGMVI